MEFFRHNKGGIILLLVSTLVIGGIATLIILGIRSDNRAEAAQRAKWAEAAGIPVSNATEFTPRCPPDHILHTGGWGFPSNVCIPGVKATMVPKP